ncbi:PAS domain-containing hybrid sensor histidine kinase/response regulator [Fuscibacter oryzae]|uniref:histidine kinase n=1 Tax=Fuscibacter oryzae TaxID=2803939 RepID=A0A8J7SSZ1_9RHOB|nr:PAS-domain containing protein [Fuscibacter oryzae]MBL4928070.1 PAS-domain containing protein [Fuscibacter oryzae]
MIEGLINPADPPERREEKLLTIARVLMRRVEQITDDGGIAYAQFERAALLEDQVRERTRELSRALDLLNETNAALHDANRQTEQARQNLASAIETVQEGFALFDANDVLVMCNSRFGMHMPDIRSRLLPGLTFDGYVDLCAHSAHLALAEGETPESWSIGRKRRHEERHVSFNVRMDFDHWVQVSEHRTADGGTVVLQTDVTDLIRLERQEMGRILDDQERLLRATLDHIDQGVAIFDREAQLVGWNARLGALLAIPVVRLRVGTAFEQIMLRLRAGFRMGQGMTEARMLTWADGRHSRPPLTFDLRHDAGLILTVFAQEMPDRGFVMSFTDITTERRAQEDLSRAKETLEVRVAERTLDLADALGRAERANASRSRFVAAASHDLLQPLSAAKLFLSAIPPEGVSAPVAETLGKAQNALVSVEAILAQLLDISRLESGRAALSVGPVPVGRLLRQLAEEFAPIALAKGLRLTVRASDAVVLSDAGYLRRILQNLIGNAIRYTDKGGVLVAARPRGTRLRLEVWDSGPGIPDEEQEAIFKEFHRIDGRASASEGMGLGLAIVERACTLLNHPLALWSRMGRGTVFMVQLPLADAAAQPEVTHRPAQLDQASAAGRIVLLVENDAELRRALTLVMEQWGAEVIEAADAAEAQSLLADLGILPDALLIDHQLESDMTGLDLIAAFRADHGILPTRLITASRDSTLRRAAAEAGVPVLEKPVSPEALRAFLAGL